MKRYPFLQRWLLVLSVALAIPAHGQNVPSEQIATFSPHPEAAVRIVQDAVRQHGGDPETQPVHLVLGFATGGFSKNPVRKAAMYALAQQLLNGFLVAGDTVSIIGFEKEVWASNWDQPFRSEDRPALWNAWPDGPASGSTGGQGYNRVLVETLQHLSAQAAAPRNYVIVLLGPWGSDLVARANESILSSNDPLFRTTLEAAGSTRFSRFPFRYTVKDRPSVYSLYMHVATPARFDAIGSRLDAPRSETLGRRKGWVPDNDAWQKGGQPGQPSPSAQPVGTTARNPRKGSVWPLILGVLAAAVAGFLLYRALGRGKSSGKARTLHVTFPDDNTSRPPITGPFGRGRVLRIVGAGFAPMEDTDVAVGRPGAIPAQSLLEIRGDGRGVALFPGAATVIVNGSQVSSQGRPVPVNTRLDTLIKGTAVFQDGRGSRDFQVRMEVKLV